MSHTMIINKLFFFIIISSIFLTLDSQGNENTLVQERELDAEEDPLFKQQVNMIKNKKEEDPFYYIFYTSLRGRYRDITNEQAIWEDYDSRLGINSWYEFLPQTWVFARYEAGFNLLQELGLNTDTNYDIFKSGETFYTRLAYIGFQQDENIVLLGKNWSTYYQVASFTDRFSSLGGEANGVYNANTDGGDSGTGRANDVLQTRFIFDTLEINLQVQDKQDIPYIENAQYKYGFGASMVLNPLKNFKIGLAYNYSDINLDSIPLDKRHNLNGNMSAYLLGVQWYSQNWYLGASYSKNYNLQTTDTESYIDSTGLEVYTQCQVVQNFWFLGGYNYSKPNTYELESKDYLLSYGILGLRYTIDGFSKMIYMEAKLDQGRIVKHYKSNNQVILGVRWDFEYSNQ